ncbi:hypothetical protein HLB03_02110 [Acidianus sp. DSM 29099]|nr:hypothetical protein [Acidianus sp. RZ1]
MLDSPSDVVVSANRCFKNFKSCRYFVSKHDEEEEKVGLESYEEEKVEQEIKFYEKVNVLEDRIDSECEFFQLIKTSSGFVAKCTLLGRILTESHAKNCGKYWQNCPIRVK